MNNSFPSEESRQLHEEKELRRYNASKGITNLKISMMFMLIVMLAIHLYVFS